MLTEHNENSSKIDSSDYIIALKERVAQSTLNCRLKEEECVGLREEIVRKDEQIRLLYQQIGESREGIEAWEQRVVEAKVVSAGLERTVAQLEQKLQAYAIDR